MASNYGNIIVLHSLSLISIYSFTLTMNDHYEFINVFTFVCTSSDNITNWPFYCSIGNTEISIFTIPVDPAIQWRWSYCMSRWNGRMIICPQCWGNCVIHCSYCSIKAMIFSYVRSLKISMYKITMYVQNYYVCTNINRKFIKLHVSESDTTMEWWCRYKNSSTTLRY